jgi:protein transport protein SEC24
VGGPVGGGGGGAYPNYSAGMAPPGGVGGPMGGPMIPQQQQYQQQQQQPQQYANGSTLPNSLLLLPLYAMSLQKSLVLRGGTDVRVDERAFFQLLLNNMDIEESKVFIYPRMFSIHDMSHDAGLPSDNQLQSQQQQQSSSSSQQQSQSQQPVTDDCATAGPLHVRLPAILNLSYERLTSMGIVLLENGYDMFMWIGRQVNPAIISTLFGVNSLDQIPDVTKLAIQAENSDFSSRVNAILIALRQERSHHLQLHFIREGDGYAEAYFARFLIEDR